jgi:hypothetical protein
MAPPETTQRSFRITTASNAQEANSLWLICGLNWNDWNGRHAHLGVHGWASRSADHTHVWQNSRFEEPRLARQQYPAPGNLTPDSKTFAASNIVEQKGCQR